MVNDVRFLAGPNGATLYLTRGEEQSGCAPNSGQSPVT